MADSREHWVAGVGCGRNCPLVDLRSLLDNALARVGVSPEDLTALATIEQKQNEPALRQLAADLGLELRVWRAEELRRFEHRLTTLSERAFELFGCYGVAESAALATAEAEDIHPAELALGRTDNGRATVALARYSNRQ